MVKSASLSLAATLLLLPSTLAAGLYHKDSGVLNIDQRSYRTLIEKSNHTSIVEFYAPWCGHCKALQPHYERAAKQLKGLAQVAAVNCDAEENKPFCGQMGVQGFPTLKIVKPGRVKDGKRGRPIVEDYQGAREAKAIVDAVIDKMPNHVKRLKDSDYQSWLGETNGPKAILFSNKGTVSALLKSIAVEFLGVLPIAQIRDKETEAVDNFSIEKFPTLLLLPGDGKDPIPYTAEMKKDKMVAFLSQAAQPNPAPDASPKKAKPPTKTDKAKASKTSSSSSKASASQASENAKASKTSSSSSKASAKVSQTDEKVADTSQPTESPGPRIDESAQKPINVPAIAPPISSLPDGLSLQQNCLNSKAGTCILALLPSGDPTLNTISAITSLSEIHHKHDKSGRKLFPFYQLPGSNSQAAALRSKLELGSDTEVIAVNGKRGWVRHFTSSSFSQPELEDWIDAIRMGDSPKRSLPDGLIVPAESLPAEPVKVDFSDPEALKNAFKGNLPEGVEFEMEEIDDETYERLMRQSKESQGDAAPVEEEKKAEEVEEEEVKVEEAHDEL
ncbi:disulfide isomerase [Teratosphaeria destructans]|uniref:protein disulfide-isomerase n=1 Tax=Teratosphaeria destructans TaxID=418781 RepID=A0A9W7SR44_9PEZI|nr:disulfide isomerase [Teratosphaeria destructans]